MVTLVEELLKWGAYVLTAIIAWLVKVIWDRQEQQQKSVTELKENLLEHYIKKEELREVVQPLLRKMDKIEQMLIQHLVDQNKKPPN